MAENNKPKLHGFSEKHRKKLMAILTLIVAAAIFGAGTLYGTHLVFSKGASYIVAEMERREMDTSALAKYLQTDDEETGTLVKLSELEDNAEDNQALITEEPESKGETSDTEAPPSAQGNVSVNINTASATELEQLPGIGPVKAAAIVEFRTTYGDFQSVDDLLLISGIGDATLEKLRPYATVN